jgi:transglutaminase-like putative cysteine protease
MRAMASVFPFDSRRLAASRAAVLLASCLALALAAAAPAAENPEDFSKGLVDRDAALAAAKGATLANYPDAEEVLVAGALRVRYNPDGTYAQWHEEFVKILTQQSRDRYRTLSSFFTIPYQRGPEDCAITLAELVKTNGTIVSLDVKAQSRVMVNPDSMDQNIYNPNEKIVKLNVPGLEVGDVLHFVMLDRVVQPRMRDSWAEWHVLEETRPILYSRLVVFAPKARPLRRIALKAEVAGTVRATQTDEGDWVRHEWEARNVPRMFPEPNMPPVHTVVQRLLLSTAPDWQTISRWYWALSEPHYAPSEEMKAKVQELTAGLTDPRRKIEELFRYVSQQIRYMGITVESTAPGYEPHDVKDTFAAKHGVCRDKAALLVVMLRLAGQDAFPTLIHSGPKKDEEVPQPYFNHAIVAVRQPDGDYRLMDPTDESTTALLPAYLNDKSYLVATPEGERLRVSPIEPAEDNLMRIQTVGALDARGGLTASTTLRFEGVNDNAYRGWFARGKPEDRRRFFEGLVKAAAPGARLADLTLEPADLMNTRTTLTVRLTYTAPDLLVAGGPETTLPLPTLGTRVGMVNFTLGRTGLKERKYPLLTDVACGVRESLTLDVRAAVGPLRAAMVSGPVDRPDLHWSLASRVTNGTLRLDGDFRLKAVEYGPSQYGALKDTLKEIERALRGQPVFESLPTPDAAAPDVTIEEERVTYELADASAWTETRTVAKRILTYGGKKANSELKIPFNPAWETVTLESATVTAPNGTSRAIASNEVNVMDAPWVGAAPRYPPERTLVASLPAVEVGSLIRWRLVRQCRDRAGFTLREPLRTFDPIRHKTVEVRAPSDLPLRLDVVEPDGRGTPFVQAKSEGLTLTTWSVTNAAAVKREDQLPPWWTYLSAARATTVGWGPHSAMLRRRLEAATSRQRETASRARDLVADARTAEEKVRRVRDFVAMRVRLTGPGVASLPLSAITPADRTLADGYGNTTDRAVLLVAMLRAVGFRPEFVLASDLACVPEVYEQAGRLPAIHDFQTVLVRLRDKGLGVPSAGAAIYLNDTDQYASLGACGHADRIGLDLGDGRLFRVLPLKPDRAQTVMRLTLGENGDARLSVRRELFGNAFGAENRRFTEMTPEERRRHHQEMLGELSQAATACGELVTDFTRYPGVIELEAQAPRYAVRLGDYLQFPLPVGLDDVLNPRADSRENPLYLSSPIHVRRTVSVAYPSSFAVCHAPEPLRLDKRGGLPLRASSEVATARQDGVALLTTQFEAQAGPAIVPSDLYEEFLRQDRLLSHARVRHVLLKAGALPAGGASVRPDAAGR